MVKILQSKAKCVCVCVCVERERERLHMWNSWLRFVVLHFCLYIYSNMFLCCGLLCLSRHYVVRIYSNMSQCFLLLCLFRLMSLYLFIIICLYFVASFPSNALKSSSLRSTWALVLGFNLNSNTGISYYCRQFSFRSSILWILYLFQIL